MASKTYSFFAAASTFLVKSGDGNVYGYTVADPAAGGTVVIADLLNVGAAPNLGVPSTIGPSLISFVKFPASPQPTSIATFGQRFANGLSISVTSTMSVIVHYD